MYIECADKANKAESLFVIFICNVFAACFALLTKIGRDIFLLEISSVSISAADNQLNQRFHRRAE